MFHYLCNNTHVPLPKTLNGYRQNRVAVRLTRRTVAGRL